MIRAPATGLVEPCAPPLPPPTSPRARATIARRRVLRARLGEVAGQHPDQLLQVAGQRGVPVHLDAEVLEGGDARRRGDAPGGGAHSSSAHAAHGGVGRRRRPPRTPPRPRPARRRARPATPGRSGPPGRGSPRSAARHHASVPGRTARWMSASSAVSLRRGSMTISARSGSLAISLSVVRACGMPWDCHGFLPMNSATSACSTSPRTIGPEHLGVDPELAGLLLGQGVRPVAGAEGPQGRPAVRAAEVVPLAATAEVEDRLATVLVPHLGEARRHLGDRGVPVDLLERPVGPSPQRAREPVAAVLVVVQAQRLLAGVALRRRVGLVAPDALEPPAVLTSEAHLDPAVALAQDAGRGLPAVPRMLVSRVLELRALDRRHRIPSVRLATRR